MLAQDLSQQLLDEWIKRRRRWELQPRVSQVRSLQTSIHRTDVVSLRCWHFRPSKLFADESMGLQSLLFALGSQMGIGPEKLAVSVEFAPVVVPGLGAVKGFGDVVVAFAMTGKVEEFVGCSCWGGGDELVQVGGEELPLGFRGVSWDFGVGARYETEVVFCLGWC